MLPPGADIRPGELCSVVRNDVSRASLIRTAVLRRSRTSEIRGGGIAPTGEEEVKVAKSEAPALIGAWCNRE
jgi:hypothetical protein